MYACVVKELESRHEKTYLLHICENKGSDHLRGNGNRAADQRFCFRFIDNIIPKFNPLAIVCGCTARFVSDLDGNPEDRFSRVAAPLDCIELPRLAN